MQLPMQPSPAQMAELMVQRKYPKDFTWSPCFDAVFLCRLASQGFLPMAMEIGLDVFPVVLLPKLHTQRSLLRFPDLHVGSSTRRKSKRFWVTLNTAFDEVVAHCNKQHGDDSWLYPPLVAGYKERIAAGRHLGTNVSFFSFEVWVDDSDDSDGAAGDKAAAAAGAARHKGKGAAPAAAAALAADQPPAKRKLVAGELGYTVGASYTSLTGFSDMPSAGTVQLCFTGRLLESLGFHFWDLGMHMDYKGELGAREVPRAEFLAMLKEARAVNDVQLKLDGCVRASAFVTSRPEQLDAGAGGVDMAPAPPAAPDGAPPMSKNQAKKLKKKEMRRERRAAAAAAAAAKSIPAESVPAESVPAGKNGGAQAVAMK